MTNSIKSTVNSVYASLISSQFQAPEIGRISHRLVNFPKETKRSNKNVKNPALTESQNISVEKLNLDSKVQSFVEICERSYSIRLEASKKIVPNNFSVDSHNFIDAVKKTPQLFYKGITTVAQLTNQADPHLFAIQLASNVGILDKNHPNYFAQKELGKLPEFINALSANRKVKNIYLCIFFIAMCEGLTDMSNFSLMYYVKNKRYAISSEVRERLSKKGGNAYTIGTAKAQSGQSKKLARALGLIDYTKNEKNTPVEIKPFARPLFEMLAGRIKTN